MPVTTAAATLEALALDQTGDDGWWLPGIPTELWTDDDGRPHREGGPAAVLRDGTQLWYADGLLHRAGGPAVMGPGWGEVWFERGAVHRVGGPAIRRETDGVVMQAWYEAGTPVRDGAWLTFTQGDSETYRLTDGEPARLHLSHPEFPPLDHLASAGQVSDPAERYWWFRNGQPEPGWWVSAPPRELWLDDQGRPHRPDGPAIVDRDGVRMWMEHGKLHRERGPAVVDLTRGEWWRLDRRFRADGPDRVDVTRKGW